MVGLNGRAYIEPIRIAEAINCRGEISHDITSGCHSQTQSDQVIYMYYNIECISTLQTMTIMASAHYFYQAMLYMVDSRESTAYGVSEEVKQIYSYELVLSCT